MLNLLATRIDTINAARRMKRARVGWPSRTRSDIQFAATSNVQFRFREQGRGRPLVFAADPPASLELYDELLATYARSFRVIVLEVPAMGFSIARSGFDFRFATLNDAIVEFLETVVKEPAVLAFSCVAGLGGIDIAERRPDLISQLILIQTPSWSEAVRWKKTRDPKGILARPIVGQLAMHRLKHERAPMWLQLAVGRKDRYASFCACAKESLDHGAGWALASAFQRYLPDAAPRLLRASQPLLAIWGNADGSHTGTSRSSSLELSSNAQRVLIEHADLGHFPELEDVSRVHTDICNFLERG